MRSIRPTLPQVSGPLRDKAAARPVRDENGRVREITGATRVYLHLAQPSAHARTPQVMNGEFARRGVDAVAVSADVAPDDLGGFARGLRGWRNLAGLSVTMPHKEALASHVEGSFRIGHRPDSSVPLVPGVPQHSWSPAPGPPGAPD